MPGLREISPRVPRPLLGALGLVIVTLLLTGCAIVGYDSYGAGASRPGGDGTSDVYGVGAFSQPASNLSADEVALFRIGDSFFTDPWSPADVGPTDRDGLGPTYLSNSCAGCHVGDGRGSAPGPDIDGAPILRFAATDGSSVILPAYGAQLQTKAVDGVPAEAGMAVEWVEEAGTYPDGTPYSLRRPIVEVTGEAFGALEISETAGVRIAPPLMGLGLLEAIPEADIVALADPEDFDGDGISGVASYVPSRSFGGDALGRFGRKANLATVADQTALAYLFDIGITTPVHPEQNCPGAQSACNDAPAGGDPEISQDRLDAVVFYARTLAVPGRRSLDDVTVVRGEEVFTSLGCAACHTQRFVTADDADLEAMRSQTIYPYTDLLLHDMGERLSDGRWDGVASPTEWRTAPLWGLGLTRSVNPDAGFLHDGRARTIEEAVLWHGGEAEPATERFKALSPADRDRLLIFLKSL